jgi:predicted phage tail protein
VGDGRLQVTVTSGHVVLTSITATQLTNVRVELPVGTLTANGQSMALNSSSVTFFVQRAGAGGAYTAELRFSDLCGAYPLFFGAGS